jgi:hypothetical protein
MAANKAPEGRLRDKWMWNRELRRILVISFVVLSIIMTLALYPSWGLYSLLNLLFSLIGISVSAMYGFVGKKVQKLKDTFSTDDCDLEETLIINGKIQSPGIAVLKEDKLALIPIVGNSITIMLRDIVSFREVSWFNGKMLWSKKGFYLNLKSPRRIGFAVKEDAGNRWSQRFADAKARSDPLK